MKSRYLTIIFCVLLSLTGCSYKILDKGGIKGHKLEKMEPSKLMPTPDELEGNKTKVVIFPFENKAPKAQVSGAGNAASGMVERYVVESGGVDIIDREAAGKLQEEIALIEMGSSQEIASPMVANYAITGEINSVHGPRGFYWPEGKPGKMVLNALLSKALDKNIRGLPEYEYTVGIRGKIKIFQLPHGNLVRTIDINDETSITKMAGFGVGQMRIGGIVQPLSASEEQGLISRATTDGVEDARNEIKNFFAPRGYVVEKRVSPDGKDTIFLVTFGAINGAKEGMEVTVYTQETSIDARTGKEVMDEEIVGRAKVADIVKSTECWIHIENKEVASRVKMGDYIKVQYSKGGSDIAKSVGKFMF